jgi:hypothetical protein
MKNKTIKRIDLTEQAEAIQMVLHQAVQHALSIHKRLGNSIAVWKDGKVVIIPADQIVLSSELPRTEE